MKKCFMYFVMLLTMAFGASVTVSAQSKAVQKDAKKRVKDLRKRAGHCWAARRLWNLP